MENKQIQQRIIDKDILVILRNFKQSNGLQNQPDNEIFDIVKTYIRNKLMIEIFDDDLESYLRKHPTELTNY
jgi:hypothetical protein